MNLDEIHALWSKDSKIDPTALSKESVEIPELHNKYYKILYVERLKLKRLTEDLYPKLIRDKREWLTGVMPQEDLKSRGWKVYQRNPLKSDLQNYLDSDADIIREKLKISYQLEVIAYLESILKVIMNKSFYIKNAIENEKFLQGIDSR